MSQSNRPKFITNIFTSYLLNLTFCKFCVRQLTSQGLSAFCNFICHVIGGCSRKQMRWFDTAFYVAFMKYKMAVWNFAEMHFPGYAVGSVKNFLSVQHFYKKSSIAGTDAAGPKPTRRSFSDVFPKSNFLGKNSEFIVTIPASCIASVKVRKFFFAIKAIGVSFVASCIPSVASDRIGSHRKAPFFGAIPRTVNAVAGFFYPEYSILEVL